MAAAMFAIDAACGNANVVQLPAGAASVLELVGYGLFAIGVTLTVWSAFGFSSAHTPIEPGSTPTTLLTRGPYRFSRNPIYLGMTITLIGWSAWLAQPVTLVGPAVFLAIIQRGFVRHEERILGAVFGEHYAAYRGRVRRWI